MSSKMTDEELYQEAVKVVAERKSASVALLQRRFRIGYVAATKMIDRMEEEGKVGPYLGNRPREVFVKNESGEE